MNISPNAQKFLGLTLLILGLVIIFYSIFNSYNIFTGKSQPAEIFKTGERGVKDSTQEEKNQVQKNDIEKITEEKLKEQLEAMIPVNALAKLLNLVSWSILAGILIFGGTQISGLGVNLLIKK